MSEPAPRLDLPPWLREPDPAGIVVSARIRLARNIADTAFPGWSGEEEGTRLCRRLLAALGPLPPLAGGTTWSMEQTEPLDRQLLRERHLISTELANKGAGSAVVVAADESLAVMVNEEDHLRIQGLAAGRNLEALWKIVDALDTAIGERVSYAVSPRLGYLTACPSNVGTGLRASVMLHLPGLKLAGDIDRVVKGLGKLGLAVRGLLGEGTEAWGGMYQVSNQATLGESEPALIARLLAVVEEVLGHESNARQRLLEARPTLVRDRVARAAALLTRARLMEVEEALDLLSCLGLGLALGWLRGVDGLLLSDLFLLVQPAHLQRRAGVSLSPEARDEWRADLLRERLAGVDWV